MNDVASEWTDRWSVLKALIEQTATQVVTPPKQPGESVVNKGKEIANLLKHLGEFSEQLVTFFRYPANQSGFKAQVAVASTLEQASNDFGLISQVIQQRSNGSLLSNLTQADLLIDAALQPAVKAGLFDYKPGKPQALLSLAYFQKSSVIRVIPYAPAALIGIPFTTLSPNGTVDQDLLAIGHEVGHYVYWNARTPATLKEANRYVANTSYFLAAQRRLLDAGIPAWARKWAEEAFADVYSARVHGPISAISFQDLQFRFNDEGFRRDDGPHPTPMLRPEGHLTTLRKMNQDKWADALEARWEQRRADWLPDGADADAAIVAHDDNGRSISLQDARPVFADMVEELNDLLPNEICFDPAVLGGAPNPQADDLEFELNKLYAAWTAHLAINPSIGPSVVFQWDENAIQTWRQNLYEQDVRYFPLRHDETPKERMWKVVIVAGGWETGPSTDAPRPP